MTLRLKPVDFLALEPAEATEDDEARILDPNAGAPARTWTPSARRGVPVADVQESAWLRLIAQGALALEETYKKFDPSKHPRWPKGTPRAGQFIKVGQRFKLNGHTYEISLITGGRIVAHEASGKPSQVSEVIVGTHKDADGMVVPDEKLDYTKATKFSSGSHGGKGPSGGTTPIINPYIDSSTHDPSIGIPANSPISDEEWQRFGDLDQAYYVELMERYGKWSPSKGKALFNAVYAGYSPTARDIVEGAVSSQYGSSSGNTLNLSKAFNYSADAYEEAKELQRELAEVIHWDLYNRTHAPDVAIFHKGNTSPSSYKATYMAGGITGGTPLMSGYSQSFKYSANNGFGPNTIATPTAIRFVTMSSHSIQSSAYVSEYEVAVAERMAVDDRTLSWATGSIGSAASKYLIGSTSEPASGAILEELKASFEGKGTLPIPPEPPGLKFKHSGTTWIKPPMTPQFAQDLTKVHAAGYLGGSKEAATMPAKDMGLVPGDMIEGLKGTRYIIVSNPDDAFGLNYAKILPGGAPDWNKVYSFEGGGSNDFRRLEGHIDLPKQPTEAGFTPWTQEQYANVVAGESKQLAQFKEGEKFKLDGEGWEVITPSVAGSNPEVRSLDTGKVATVNAGYKAAQLVTLDGFTEPAPGSAGGGLLPPLKVEKGDVFAYGMKRYVVTGVLKDGTVKAKPKGGKVMKLPQAVSQALTSGDVSSVEGLGQPWRPDKYQLGPKEKAAGLVPGDLISLSPSVLRPARVKSVVGNKVTVTSLDDGAESEFTKQKHVTRVIAADALPVTASPQAQAANASQHPAPGAVNMGAFKQGSPKLITDLAVGDLFTTANGTPYVVAKPHNPGVKHVVATNLTTGKPYPVLATKSVIPLTPKAGEKVSYAEAGKGDVLPAGDLKAGDRVTISDPADGPPGTYQVLVAGKKFAKGGSWADVTLGAVGPDGKVTEPSLSFSPFSPVELHGKIPADGWPVEQPSAVNPSGLPDAPLKPFKGTYGAGGAFKYHPAGTIGDGTLIVGSGSKDPWVVVSKGDGNVVVTDGKAYFKVPATAKFKLAQDGPLKNAGDAELTKKASELLSAAQSADGENAPDSSAGDGSGLMVNDQGLAMKDMTLQPGSKVVMNVGGAVWTVQQAVPSGGYTIQRDSDGLTMTTTPDAIPQKVDASMIVKAAGDGNVPGSLDAGIVQKNLVLPIMEQILMNPAASLGEQSWESVASAADIPPGELILAKAVNTPEDTTPVLMVKRADDPNGAYLIGSWPTGPLMPSAPMPLSLADDGEWTDFKHGRIPLSSLDSVRLALQDMNTGEAVEDMNTHPVGDVTPGNMIYTYPDSGHTGWALLTDRALPDGQRLALDPNSLEAFPIAPDAEVAVSRTAGLIEMPSGSQLHPYATEALKVAKLAPAGTVNIQPDLPAPDPADVPPLYNAWQPSNEYVTLESLQPGEFYKIGSYSEAVYVVLPDDGSGVLTVRAASPEAAKYGTNPFKPTLAPGDAVLKVTPEPGSLVEPGAEPPAKTKAQKLDQIVAEVQALGPVEWSALTTPGGLPQKFDDLNLAKGALIANSLNGMAYRYGGYLEGEHVLISQNGDAHTFTPAGQALWRPLMVKQDIAPQAVVSLSPATLSGAKPSEQFPVISANPYTNSLLIDNNVGGTVNVPMTDVIAVVDSGVSHAPPGLKEGDQLYTAYAPMGGTGTGPYTVVNPSVDLTPSEPSIATVDENGNDVAVPLKLLDHIDKADPAFKPVEAAPPGWPEEATVKVPAWLGLAGIPNDEGMNITTGAFLSAVNPSSTEYQGWSAEDVELILKAQDTETLHILSVSLPPGPSDTGQMIGDVLDSKLAAATPPAGTPSLNADGIPAWTPEENGAPAKIRKAVAGLPFSIGKPVTIGDLQPQQVAVTFTGQLIYAGPDFPEVKPWVVGTDNHSQAKKAYPLTLTDAASTGAIEIDWEDGGLMTNGDELQPGVVVRKLTDEGDTSATFPEPMLVVGRFGKGVHVKELSGLGRVIYIKNADALGAQGGLHRLLPPGSSATPDSYPPDPDPSWKHSEADSTVAMAAQAAVADLPVNVGSDLVPKESLRAGQMGVTPEGQIIAKTGVVGANPYLGDGTVVPTPDVVEVYPLSLHVPNDVTWVDDKPAESSADVPVGTFVRYGDVGQPKDRLGVVIGKSGDTATVAFLPPDPGAAFVYVDSSTTSMLMVQKPVQSASGGNVPQPDPAPALEPGWQPVTASPGWGALEVIGAMPNGQIIGCTTTGDGPGIFAVVEQTEQGPRLWDYDKAHDKVTAGPLEVTSDWMPQFAGPVKPDLIPAYHDAAPAAGQGGGMPLSGIADIDPVTAGLNPQNLGPHGKPRNVKQMGVKKLKALYLWDATDPDLRVRVADQLIALGYTGVSGGTNGATVPEPPPPDAPMVWNFDGISAKNLTLEPGMRVVLANGTDAVIEKQLYNGGYELSGNAVYTAVSPSHIFTKIDPGAVMTGSGLPPYAPKPANDGLASPSFDALSVPAEPITPAEPFNPEDYAASELKSIMQNPALGEFPRELARQRLIALGYADVPAANDPANAPTTPALTWDDLLSNAPVKVPASVDDMPEQDEPGAFDAPALKWLVLSADSTPAVRAKARDQLALLGFTVPSGAFGTGGSAAPAPAADAPGGDDLMDALMKSVTLGSWTGNAPPPVGSPVLYKGEVMRVDTVPSDKVGGIYTVKDASGAAWMPQLGEMKPVHGYDYTSLLPLSPFGDLAVGTKFLLDNGKPYRKTSSGMAKPLFSAGAEGVFSATLPVRPVATTSPTFNALVLETVTGPDSASLEWQDSANPTTLDALDVGATFSHGGDVYALVGGTDAGDPVVQAVSGGAVATYGKNPVPFDQVGNAEDDIVTPVVVKVTGAKQVADGSWTTGEEVKPADLKDGDLVDKDGKLMVVTTLNGLSARGINLSTGVSKPVVISGTVKRAKVKPADSDTPAVPAATVDAGQTIVTPTGLSGVVTGRLDFNSGVEIMTSKGSKRIPPTAAVTILGWQPLPAGDAPDGSVQPGVQSDPPDGSIEPYKSAWGSGGKYKHDFLKDVTVGEHVRDKTGAVYVLVGFADDGDAILRLDAPGGKATEFKTAANQRVRRVQQDHA